MTHTHTARSQVLAGIAAGLSFAFIATVWTDSGVPARPDTTAQVNACGNAKVIRKVVKTKVQSVSTDRNAAIQQSAATADGSNAAKCQVVAGKGKCPSGCMLVISTATPGYSYAPGTPVIKVSQTNNVFQVSYTAVGTCTVQPSCVPY